MEDRPPREPEFRKRFSARPVPAELGLEGAHRGRDRSDLAAKAAALQDLLCRLLSIGLAALGILVCAPILIGIALLVRLTSPGPVLYTQVRVGVDRRRRGPPSNTGRRRVDHGGKLFRIYKFRTMYVGSDRTGETWATRQDPRVTPVGRWLRQSRLDELPQLFNVLRGDMNIVGPRPEQPGIFGVLRNRFERYGDRQRVLPGLTGLAQIHLSYDTTIDGVRRKLDYDLAYIERRTVLEDIRIMVRTVPVVFFRRGGW